MSRYVAAPDKRLYGVHFWAYPALALPAKLVLRLSGGNEFKAFQVTNVLFALGTLAHVLFLSGLPAGARRLLAALLVTSPFLPFLLWPHPEVVTGALVTSSLVFRHGGRRAAAVLAMAVASLQAAPLALAATLFWAEGAWNSRRLGWDARLRTVGRLSLALAPAILPALFALVAFGHPSPLVLAGAYDRRHISVFRALELLVDPNLGLLPYVPLTLALALALAFVRVARRRAESEQRASPDWLLAAVALIAFASTGAANWNHGTVGPSRYGLWLLPFLFVLLAEALVGPSRGARRYQAQTVPALITLRKWEISGVCLFFMLLPWFLAGYTNVRPRKLLIGLTVIWGLIFAANLVAPYGTQYADLPGLTYFELPWGESVVDLRVLQPSIWHRIGILGVLGVMAFGAYACTAHYRRGQQKRARALAWALGLFFVSILFNCAVNREVIEFVHLSDLGFLALLVMMDMGMTLESRLRRPGRAEQSHTLNRGGWESVKNRSTGKRARRIPSR